jgi:DNA-binding response OmpR family regulator
MGEARITVVNQDTAFLNLMSDLLSGEGYQTTLVPASDQAYEMIRKDRPDLVILDVGSGQPGNGWTVLNLLRLDPETASIPVIVASVDRHFLETKEEQLKAKNCVILEKPFALDELLHQVKSALDC